MTKRSWACLDGNVRERLRGSRARMTKKCKRRVTETTNRELSSRDGERPMTKSCISKESDLTIQKMMRGDSSSGLSPFGNCVLAIAEKRLMIDVRNFSESKA